MFKVSSAKKEILQKLAERDWTPTDLADELGKTPETVYNHLHDLEKQGILTKRQVAAKTRPKTEYSIDTGLIQYITVLPGQFHEGVLPLSETKEAMFRIWTIPQNEFHPYLEQYWWALRNHADIDFQTDIAAVGVYGSVARGDADHDSDLDLLIITTTDEAEATVNEHLGSTRLRIDETSKIGMTEVYTQTDYRNSLAHASDFLTTVRDELHPIYDPDRILIRPETVVNDK